MMRLRNTSDVVYLNGESNGHESPANEDRACQTITSTNQSQLGLDIDWFLNSSSLTDDSLTNFLHMQSCNKERLSFLAPNSQSLQYHISMIHSPSNLVAAQIFRISKNFYPGQARPHYNNALTDLKLTYDNKGADIVVLFLENVVQNKQTHTWEIIETV